MFVVLSLEALLGSLRYGIVERLAHYSMVQAFGLIGGLLWVLKEMIHRWFEIRLLKVIYDMTVDPVLAFLEVARVAEVEWGATPSQAWHLYVYKDAAIICILEAAHVRLQQANDVKV